MISEVNRSIITPRNIVYVEESGEDKGKGGLGEEERFHIRRQRRGGKRLKSRRVLRPVCLAHLDNHRDKNIHKTNYSRSSVCRTIRGLTNSLLETSLAQCDLRTARQDWSFPQTKISLIIRPNKLLQGDIYIVVSDFL